MSEQKMPALPWLGIDTEARYGPRIRGYTVEQAERIRDEAIKFGRQQERERLEPLRVAVEALMKARIESEGPLRSFEAVSAALDAEEVVIATARNLLEQPE